MLSIPPSTKIFIYSQSVDMRLAFDGLSGIISEVLRQDSFSGHLFVFFSRCKKRVKVLFWDRDGYVIWYKRLEEGTFLVSTWLEGRKGASVEVSATEFYMLLGGISSRNIIKQKRYSKGPNSRVAGGKSVSDLNGYVSSPGV